MDESPALNLGPIPLDWPYDRSLARRSPAFVVGPTPVHGSLGDGPRPLKVGFAGCTCILKLAGVNVGAGGSLLAGTGGSGDFGGEFQVGVGAELNIPVDLVAGATGGSLVDVGIGTAFRPSMFGTAFSAPAGLAVPHPYQRHVGAALLLFVGAAPVLVVVVKVGQDVEGGTTTCELIGIGRRRRAG